MHEIRREKRTTISEVIVLPQLRTLTQKKRSQNCPRFETGGLSLYPLLSRNIIFFPALTMAARAKNKTFLAKRFAHAISVRYRDFEHAYVY